MNKKTQKNMLLRLQSYTPVVALCVSAFFLGSMTETFADKGGKGGGKGR